MVRKNLLILILFFCAGILAVSLTACAMSAGSDDHRIVSQGEEFTLQWGESAQLGVDGPEIKILEFYNSPCPAGVECVWSGQGIRFEWSYKGETVQGLNRFFAFGRQINILETDYETFARLVEVPAP